MERAQGFAMQGAQTVYTVGLGSHTLVQGTAPYAKITVYDSGTTNLSVIFDDNQTPPTPQANPFTANADGYWFFYAVDGRYDVMMEADNWTWTIGDILLGDHTSWSGNQDAGGNSVVNLGGLGFSNANCPAGALMALNDVCALQISSPIQVPSINLNNGVCSATIGFDAQCDIAFSNSAGNTFAYLTQQGDFHMRDLYARNLNLTGNGGGGGGGTLSTSLVQTNCIQLKNSATPLTMWICLDANGNTTVSDANQNPVAWIGQDATMTIGGTAKAIGAGVLNVVDDVATGHHSVICSHLSDDGNAPGFYCWKQRGPASGNPYVQLNDALMFYGWGGWSNVFPNANQGSFWSLVTDPDGSADVLLNINDGTDNTLNGTGQTRLRFFAKGRPQVAQFAAPSVFSTCYIATVAGPQKPGGPESGGGIEFFSVGDYMGEISAWMYPDRTSWEVQIWSYPDPNLDKPATMSFLPTGQVGVGASGGPASTGIASGVGFQISNEELRVSAGSLAGTTWEGFGIEIWYNRPTDAGQYPHSGGIENYNYDLARWETLFVNGGIVSINPVEWAPGAPSPGLIGLRTLNPQYQVHAVGTFGITDPATAIPYFTIQADGRMIGYQNQNVGPWYLEHPGQQPGYMHHSSHQWGIPGFVATNDLNDSAYLFVAGSGFAQFSEGMARNFNIMCNNSIVFHSNTVPPYSGERLRIDADGNIYITGHLYVQGNLIA